MSILFQVVDYDALLDVKYGRGTMFASMLENKFRPSASASVTRRREVALALARTSHAATTGGHLVAATPCALAATLLSVQFTFLLPYCTVALMLRVWARDQFPSGDGRPMLGLMSTKKESEDVKVKLTPRKLSV